MLPRRPPPKSSPRRPTPPTVLLSTAAAVAVVAAFSSRPESRGRDAMPPPHNPPFSSSLPPCLLPRRRHLTPPGSPPLRRTASSTAEATTAAATTVSPYALARSPFVSSAEAEQESVVRVYGSNDCPVAWHLRVSFLYKAAAPVHFTPSEAAPLGRPVLRLSTPDPEVSSAADELLRQVDARFEGKPRVAPSERPAARALLAAAAAAAEEVADLVRLQHRSAERRLEGVAAKVAEMVEKAGKGRDVVEGAEVRRVGKWYGDAMEVMLEHARMEEKVLFPDIQRFS